MAQTNAAAAAPTPIPDERLLRTSRLRKVLTRPELGILAVAVALLMIGGEFDLSIGSMIGASGMIMALLAVEYGWTLWLAALAALGFALVIGFINGAIVVRTGLPSFIVTLATLFIIRGALIGTTRLI